MTNDECQMTIAGPALTRRIRGIGHWPFVIRHPSF